MDIVTTLGLRVRRTKRIADAAVVVAVIAAQNEEARIEWAIRSLRHQTSPPDLIVVCADNSTDDTAERADAAGAFVHRTVGNRDGTVGALNQALDSVLPELREEDAILLLDADSNLSSMFLSEAIDRLRNGVGCVTAETATLLSVPTLRHVIWARENGLIPGGSPRVYDTELDDLPLALLRLGHKVVSPQGPRPAPV